MPTETTRPVPPDVDLIHRARDGARITVKQAVQQSRKAAATPRRSKRGVRGPVEPARIGPGEEERRRHAPERQADHHRPDGLRRQPGSRRSRHHPGTAGDRGRQPGGRRAAGRDAGPGRHPDPAPSPAPRRACPGRPGRLRARRDNRQRPPIRRRHRGPAPRPRPQRHRRAVRRRPVPATATTRPTGTGQPAAGSPSASVSGWSPPCRPARQQRASGKRAPAYPRNQGLRHLLVTICPWTQVTCGQVLPGCILCIRCVCS